MTSSLVMADLTRWGPDRTDPAPSLVEAQAYCRQLALRQYENFPVLTWALPRDLRQPFCDIYAFCRWADDLGDEAGSTTRATELLLWWRTELQACFAGNCSHPVFVSLQPTITKYQLPPDPFLDLISAFEQDQRVTNYNSLPQLLDYCRRSANPVGNLVLRLCGRCTAQNLVWSDAICTGLQLANFWQDVARDYAIGRVYLPRDERLHFGVTDEELAQQRTTVSFQNLLQHEVGVARELLLSGAPLVKEFRGRLRVEIDLFLRGGLQILREIERCEYRVWEQRPKVSKHQFLWLAMQSLLNRPH